MTAEKTEALDRFESRLMREIEVNNAKYDEMVIHFATQVEPLLPPNPQIYMQPPQQIRGFKELNPSSETNPGYLQKDMSPTEVSEWKRRYEAYLEDGTNAGQKPTLSTIKRVFDRLMNDHWKHRIGHKLEDVRSKDDIYDLMDRELEITFPIMGRRATFSGMTQKSGSTSQISIER